MALLESWVSTPGNFQGILLVVVTITFALLLHWLVFYLLLKSTNSISSTPWRSVLKKIRTLALFGFIVLAIKFTLPLVVMPPNTELFLNYMVRLLLVGITGWLVLQMSNGLLEYSIARQRIDVEDNLVARKMRTRLRVLRQALATVIVLVTIAAMLLVFPEARSIGLSLFASAGVAGIVVGFAARPVLSNLLAGIQIALTQPIRIDDAVVIEGEWGWIEEITSTYVVIKIWDWRRLVVPLSQVIEKPFQNWTRQTASIIGSVTWHTDYSLPVDAMRSKLMQLLQDSPHWDGDVQVLQVVEAGPETMTLRALMSAKNSPTAWDLRCEIREKMIAWLQNSHPTALPRKRLQGELLSQTTSE
ncbi:small-conductance mechanosensitive channel [Alteromonadaceae bacterium 2753L.S.0a.02]|nr:small-conductance mechanosensitive channel [Alteromonadaceae bacterium 2753L.S.0a.02]